MKPMHSLSETHYSLKEMETFMEGTTYTVAIILSETHYSLKEMETFVNVIKPHCDLYTSETHYSLKEMETTYFGLIKLPYSFCVRNPLLSERDGNKVF